MKLFKLDEHFFLILVGYVLFSIIVVDSCGSCFFFSNNCCVDSFGYLSCEQQDQDHEQFEMEQRDEDLNDTDNELEHLAQHVRHDQIHFDMYVIYLVCVII